MEREPRLPHLGGAAAGGVAVGGLGGAQRAHAQLAVLQHLGVANGYLGARGHRGPRRRRQPNAYPAHQVLAEIDQRLAGRRALDRHRAQFLHGPHRRHRRRRQGGQVVIDHLDRPPPARVVTGLRPAAQLTAGVMSLAVVQVGAAQWSDAGTPFGIGAERQHRSVGKGDLELRQQRQAVGVEVAGAAEPETAARPTVAHDGADGVVAVAQQLGDVMAGEAQAVAVAGPARRQLHVADAAAVDLHLVHAEGGHRQHGPPPRLRQGELAAKVGAGLRRARRGRAGRRDEARRPVAGLQQRRPDVERLAPVARHPVGAGNADAARHALARCQRRRRPRHQHGVARGDRPAAVLQIPGHFDLVGGLIPVRCGGGDAPGQARGRGGHERAGAAMLGGQVDNGDRHDAPSVEVEHFRQLTHHR